MPDPLIATYELNYQKGKVVVLGIYSDDIIANSKFNKYFDSLLMKYAPIKRSLKMGKPLMEILTDCKVGPAWQGRI